jgi:transcriptional regulator with XRE-family HTH domain
VNTRQLTGSRIRSLRLDRGLRQAELARRCDISASYLNLIEHNRRKIGGALLNRLARSLNVDPASLSEGAERALTSSVESAASRHPDTGAETDRAEDFAGRFPGWARLVEAQHREAQRLERVVEGLNDRLTHDPFLSASLHDVLSSVTAIRSASAILADGGEIAPEWQARFHRNILEDSRRLAQSAEQLVSYLDAGADVERGMSLPQEELEVWLEGTGWSVPELEQDAGADTQGIVDASDALVSAASRHLAQAFLEQYALDAAAVPQEALRSAVEVWNGDPAQLAARFGVSLSVIFRRLSTLPARAFPDGSPRGLVACDGSGTLVFRKPISGFDLPRYGAACPLWPLFQALQRPMQPVRQTLIMSGRDEAAFTAWAVAEVDHPSGFDGPSVVEAWMLLSPRQGLGEGEAAVGVGTSCRICAQPRCPARREPSLVARRELPAVAEVQEKSAI